MTKGLVGVVAAALLTFGVGCQDDAARDQKQQSPGATDTNGTGGSGQENIDDAEKVNPHTMGGTDQNASEPKNEQDEVGAGGSGNQEPQLQDAEAPAEQQDPQGTTGSAGSNQTR